MRRKSQLSEALCPHCNRKNQTHHCWWYVWIGQNLSPYPLYMVYISPSFFYIPVGMKELIAKTLRNPPFVTGKSLLAPVAAVTWAAWEVKAGITGKRRIFLITWEFLRTAHSGRYPSYCLKPVILISPQAQIYSHPIIIDFVCIQDTALLTMSSLHSRNWAEAVLGMTLEIVLGYPHRAKWGKPWRVLLLCGSWVQHYCLSRQGTGGIVVASLWWW